MAQTEVLPETSHSHIHSKRRSKLGRGIFPILLLLPALILFIVFTLYPVVNGFIFSFMDWDGFTEGTWVGFGNYERAIADPLFWKSMSHNVTYAFATVIGKVIIGLMLAILLNQGLRGSTFYRTVIFIPVVLSFVAVGLLWSWVYNPLFGLLNSLLSAIGIDSTIAWLGEAHLALGSLITVDIWKWAGYHMILFLAGLQNVSKDLYEAAEVDGASKSQKFFRITLPLLVPVIVINTTIAFMGGFNVFDLVYAMTGGGPYHATEVIMTYTYSMAFEFHSLGYGAAISYLLFAVIMMFTLVQLAFMRKRD